MSKSVNVLLKEIVYLHAAVNEHRPFDVNIWNAIQEKLRIVWVYNSNAIEGNALSLGETAFFLREGLTSEGKPLKDFLEARNHQEAIFALEEVILNKRELTESLIKELHAVLMQGLDFTYAKGAFGQMVKKPMNVGAYKSLPNHVLTLSGKIHHYCDPLKVPDEMQALINWLNNCEEDVVMKAAIFHYKFVSIHPFDDGNGRMARILMNLILMKGGYFPCVIRNVRRRDYLNALSSVDVSGNFDEFVQFVGEELVVTIEDVLKILEGKEVESFSSGRDRFERRKVILRGLQEGAMSIGELLSRYPAMKRPTLKNDLKSLVEAKKVKKRGVGSGVRYFI